MESGAPMLSHWGIPIGCFYERSILLVQCQLININKLVSGEEQGPTSGEVVFIEQNGNFEKSQELKGRSEKFKNP
jgi:hypothetical protein